MTAIKTTKGAAATDGAPDLPTADDRPTPLHITGVAAAAEEEGGSPSYDVKPSGLFDFDSPRRGGGSAADLAAARDRFVSAVRAGVTDLMAGHGYSRERATDLLLGTIRESDSRPEQEHLFVVMDNLGLGLVEAETTLTVARALRRARSARGGGGTAADAMQDLTSRLCLTRLLGEATKPERARAVSVPPTAAAAAASPATATTTDRSGPVPGPAAKKAPGGRSKRGGVDTTSAAHKPPVPSSAPSLPHRPAAKAERKKTARSTSGGGGGGRQKSPRKRSFAASSEEGKKDGALPRKKEDGKKNSSKIGDDDDVDAQVAKKAKISQGEETPSSAAAGGGEPSPAASLLRCKSPANSAVVVGTARTKRGVPNRGDDQLQAAQAVKRTRADSDLQA